MSDAPFLSVPSGVDLARYFWHETERRNPGCDGISLFREGRDYCYLWVTATVDLDMWEAHLLDVSTNVHAEDRPFTETRDFLFLFAGGGGRFEVEWHNQPIRFDAATEAHRDRFVAGMAWFTSRIEQAIEDADAAGGTS